MCLKNRTLSALTHRFYDIVVPFTPRYNISVPSMQLSQLIASLYTAVKQVGITPKKDVFSKIALQLMPVTCVSKEYAGTSSMTLKVLD